MNELRLTVNGEKRAAAPGTTVSGLLTAMGVDPARVAVERNEDVVPRKTWGEATLGDGGRPRELSLGREKSSERMRRPRPLTRFGHQGQRSVQPARGLRLTVSRFGVGEIEQHGGQVVVRGRFLQGAAQQPRGTG